MKKSEVIRMIESYGAVKVRDGKHIVYRLGDEMFIVSHSSRTHMPAVTRKMEKSLKAAAERARLNVA